VQRKSPTKRYEDVTTQPVSAAPPAQAGPHDSFDAFFRREYSHLVRILVPFARSEADAEELAQEAMVRVLERWQYVKTLASPGGYAYCTAVNLLRVRHRRQQLSVRRQAQLISRTQNAAKPNDPETRSDLVTALRSLPRAQRDALLLTEWYGLSSAEAASLLRVRDGSVRSRASRARASLRDALRDYAS
jgi:RNA polymerase sigma factor (sigma-70 family)